MNGSREQQGQDVNVWRCCVTGRDQVRDVYIRFPSEWRPRAKHEHVNVGLVLCGSRRKHLPAGFSSSCPVNGRVLLGSAQVWTPFFLFPLFNKARIKRNAIGLALLFLAFLFGVHSFRLLTVKWLRGNVILGWVTFINPVSLILNNNMPWLLFHVA